MYRLIGNSRVVMGRSTQSREHFPAFSGFTLRAPYIEISIFLSQTALADWVTCITTDEYVETWRSWSSTSFLRIGGLTRRKD